MFLGGGGIVVGEEGLSQACDSTRLSRQQEFPRRLPLLSHPHRVAVQVRRVPGVLQPADPPGRLDPLYNSNLACATVLSCGPSRPPPPLTTTTTKLVGKNEPLLKDKISLALFCTHTFGFQPPTPRHIEGSHQRAVWP